MSSIVLHTQFSVEVLEICKHEAIVLMENDVPYHPIKWFLRDIFGTTF